jgi:hypothetical protein
MIMLIEQSLLKGIILETVGQHVITAMTKDIIMRNRRSITSEDTILNIITIIITGRLQDTIIVINTIIIIHTGMAFGFFGGATKFFGDLTLQPTANRNMLYLCCMI